MTRPHAPALPTTTTSRRRSVAPAARRRAGRAARFPTPTGIAVQRDTSQLLSFGLFKSKDPFVQQLSDVSAPPPRRRRRRRRRLHRVQKHEDDDRKVGTRPRPRARRSLRRRPSSPRPRRPPARPRPTPVIPPTGVPERHARDDDRDSAPPAPATVLISTNGVCEQVARERDLPRRRGHLPGRRGREERQVGQDRRSSAARTTAARRRRR